MCHGVQWCVPYKSTLPFTLSPLPMPAVAERRVRQCFPHQHYKPTWARLLAVAVAMSCMAGGVVNYTKAGQMLEVKLGYFNTVFEREPADLSEPASDFVKRWFHNFRTKGNVDDAPRSGRPPKIPDLAAREAAEILSAGYTVQRTVRQQPVVEHKYFSTVAEAVASNTILQQTLRTYAATPEQLLDAIHRVAPDVERRRVTFRHQLSTGEMSKRTTVAAGLLQRYHADPNLLQRMVFIDETTILTHSLKHEHIDVWVNRSDPTFHDFHGVPGKAWDPVKVHVIAAVTAHPSYQGTHGLVYMEFTTGTTDIARRVNKRLDGSTASAHFTYLVSDLLLLNAYDTARAR